MSTPVDEKGEPWYELQKQSKLESNSEACVPVTSHTSRQHGRTSTETTAHNSDSCSIHQQPQQVSTSRTEADGTQAEPITSNPSVRRSTSLGRSRSRRQEPVEDEFEVNTGPVHETAGFKPPAKPTTKLARFVKRVHEKSITFRYMIYITPLTLIFLIPLVIGATDSGPNKRHVGGVDLMWFSIWLEVWWLSLWAGRIAAKCVPYPFGIIASIWTVNNQRWHDMAKQVELSMTLVFWAVASEVSWLRIMRENQVSGFTGNTDWINNGNKYWVTQLVGCILYFVEKVIIQLIAIRFHLRTYSDRIEKNEHDVAVLTKLYAHSRKEISAADSEFDVQDESRCPSGTRTPIQIVEAAQKSATKGLRKFGDVASKVAGDFAGKKVLKSDHPQKSIRELLATDPSAEKLARRLWRTFKRQDQENIVKEDLRPAFDTDEEAEEAFGLLDKNENQDISMEELSSFCVEACREKIAINRSLKQRDSVVKKFDSILFFIVVVVVIIVFVSLISESAIGALGTAGSTLLALSWLFGSAASELLESIIFVFVKHPFDIGDRVSVYGNTGSAMKGDDYYVRKISLLYTEFQKMEGHIVQAPNSYLNTLFILNQRRSDKLFEAVPMTFKFGTTIDQINQLREELAKYVAGERGEFEQIVLTEIRDVQEAHAIVVNIVFCYKTNWQDEKLRLQRRNKFICAIITAIGVVGIEGPRMRLPGQKLESPFYIHDPSGKSGVTTSDRGDLPPSLDGASDMPSTSPDPPFVSPAESAQEGTTIRSRTPSRSRPRGESISAMAKRVDFSLGMKDATLMDFASDVLGNDTRPYRVSELSRSATKSSHARRSESIRRSVDNGESSAIDNDTSGSLRRWGTNDSTSSRLRKTFGSISRTKTWLKRSPDESQERSSDLAEKGIMSPIPEGVSRRGSKSNLATQGTVESSRAAVGKTSVDTRTTNKPGPPDRNTVPD